MNMSLENAILLLSQGYVIVVDSKSKILHKQNTETGETKIEYKSQYLLQSLDNPYDQRKISKQTAKKLTKSFENIPECFQWSSLKSN